MSLKSGSEGVVKVGSDGGPLTRLNIFAVSGNPSKCSRLACMYTL